MVISATFENISVIPWRSVLLVEERKSLTSFAGARIELTTLVVMALIT